MSKYIATFGCGQKYEGYYIEITASSYGKAIEYMETEYEGKYCMVYGEEQWNEWVAKADKEGFMVEELLKRATI
ncbi:MAG: hypothetical protein ACRCX2_04365 [Paraclostridium sp.]